VESGYFPELDNSVPRRHVVVFVVAAAAWPSNVHRNGWWPVVFGSQSKVNMENWIQSMECETKQNFTCFFRLLVCKLRLIKI